MGWGEVVQRGSAGLGVWRQGQAPRRKVGHPLLSPEKTDSRIPQILRHLSARLPSSCVPDFPLRVKTRSCPNYQAEEDHAPPTCRSDLKAGVCSVPLAHVARRSRVRQAGNTAGEAASCQSQPFLRH